VYHLPRVPHGIHREPDGHIGMKATQYERRTARLSRRRLETALGVLAPDLD
jgi:hypothetical protein